MKTKNITGALCLGLSALIPGAAHAEELWNAYPIRGFAEGLPAGMTPPPGVYAAMSGYWADDKMYDNDGDAIPGTDLSALVITPVVQWVPGVKIFGGDYSASVAQPIVYTSSSGLSGSRGSGNWGRFNRRLSRSTRLEGQRFVREGWT